MHEVIREKNIYIYIALIYISLIKLFNLLRTEIYYEQTHVVILVVISDEETYFKMMD